MFLSIFDLFKIGIGPSSSHTMGPMVAARRFLEFLRDECNLSPPPVDVRLTCSLHGSLAFTGKGHGSDRAVVLGLMGCIPETLDPDSVDECLAGAQQQQCVIAEGFPQWRFDPSTDLVFDTREPLAGHANGMRFRACDAGQNCLAEQVYYSIGGGFVVTEDGLRGLAEESAAAHLQAVPFGFDCAASMVSMAQQHGLSIAEMKRRNEVCFREPEQVALNIQRIWHATRSCIQRGLSQCGELPGGLQVRRRAKSLFEQLLRSQRRGELGPTATTDWLAAYALAVNEENASGSRVVTAPTNGAAGVIPAVLYYHLQNNPQTPDRAIEDFLLTAAAIGGIIKTKASISGAEMGCQGEVGTASAMAAAGLAAILGGSPSQVENAAEIALEHHLGLTCDPVAGLVQVPCIERNAMGAVKAMTAASLALHGDGQHIVSLDACIESMRQTGRDMDAKYKETSQGGLAVNVVAC